MVAKVVLRAMYGYDGDAVSEETGLKCLDASMAEVDQQKDTDINVIVARFGITGQLPAAGSLPLVTNGDFAEALDLRGALDLMRSADDAFMALPADVRTRFGNDPVEYVNFCSDPANVDEMVRLGLAVERDQESEKVMKVEVVNGPQGGESGGSRRRRRASAGGGAGGESGAPAGAPGAGDRVDEGAARGGEAAP